MNSNKLGRRSFLALILALFGLRPTLPKPLLSKKSLNFAALYGAGPDPLNKATVDNLKKPRLRRFDDYKAVGRWSRQIDDLSMLKG